ncbi:MAG: electron transport complex subunit RsxC [Negativicutes bacterium]
MAKTFLGGVHPPEQKITAKRPVELIELPDKFYYSTRMHIGAPCEPVVKVGDLVKKGQVIAATEAFVSANIHASTSGKVTAIESFAHPVFGTCQTVIVEADQADEWLSGLPLAKPRDWEALSPAEITAIIRSAGIVGMGGATFPTHVKTTVPAGKCIEYFILNGAECEPYLTSDHRLMLDEPESIIRGMRIGMKAVGATKGIIGIERNKPDAIAALAKAATGTGIEIVPLKVKYPQGAEKTLIQVVTGKEVPSGGLPSDVGVLVQNVATAMAVSDAVVEGIPLIARYATVSGGAVREPKNILVLTGMLFSHIFEQCGGFIEKPGKILLGGPMMGIAQQTADVPVIKGTSGILALTVQESCEQPERSCIRCGKCVSACPMGLVPSILSILGERGDFQTAKEEYNLLDCVECGSCVYVCPAKRNIVQYVRLQKHLNTQQALRATQARQ